MQLPKTFPSFTYSWLPRTYWYKMFIALVLTSCLVAVQLQALQDNEIINLQFNSTLVTFQQSDYDTFRSDGFKVRSMVTCCTRCYQVSYNYKAQLLFCEAYYRARKIIHNPYINKNTRKTKTNKENFTCLRRIYLPFS